MREGCCWAVGKGDIIRIWTDPWIPNLVNKKPDKPINLPNDARMVKDLIIHEENRWDEVKL